MPEGRTAVIFGAGSVGRGFLGQLLSESAYRIVFVDVDESLVDALARQESYTLRLSGLDKIQDLTIGAVRAISSLQSDQVAEKVAKADLAATAVGVRSLADIARPISVGLAQRWHDGRTTPFNIIVCENLRDAPDLLRGYVRAGLPAGLQRHLEQRVGFVPAVIARMSPVPTPEQRRADPTLIIAEPYKVLPVDRQAFVGEIPHVVGMEPVAPFAAYVDRKLYIHNAAHAVLGYLGYHRHYRYGYEALADLWIRRRVDQALDEASHALIAEHSFDPVALREHVDYLLLRFTNRALADPISRLARDPLRKLAPRDRLVGAARLAEKHRIQPAGIAWGISAALAYDDPEDAHAVELQERLTHEGLDAVLSKTCGIQADEPLAEMVRSRYQELLESKRGL